LRDHDRDELQVDTTTVRGSGRGSGGRLGGLIGLAAAAGFVGIIIVGLLSKAGESSGQVAGASGPPGSAAPATATPAASRSPRPTPSPTASPLPTSYANGDAVIADRRLVNASTNGMVLDVGAGTLTQLGMGSWRSVFLPAREGGYLCLCEVDMNAAGDVIPFGRPGPNGSTAGRVAVALERYDHATVDPARRDVLVELKGTPPPGGDPTDFGNWTATLGPDHRHAYLMTTERRPPSWHLELHVVDVAAGRIVQSVPLTDIPVDLPDVPGQPSPDPSQGEGVWVWASQTTLATDGTAGFFSINENRQRRDSYSNIRHAWTIDLAPDGRVAGSHPQPPVTQPDTEWCMDLNVWTDRDQIADVCNIPNTPGSGFAVRTWDREGHRTGEVPVETQPLGRAFELSQPIVDRRSGLLYLWDATHGTIVRVDLRAHTSTSTAVPPDQLEAASRRLGRSQEGTWLEPGMAISPFGDRLFALGIGQDGIGSTGVWVFDARTLDLVDHWQPVATYNSVAVSADGRHVYVAGAPRMDDRGNATNWPSSLTVYDAVSGQIERVFGAVDRDNAFVFARLPDS
jgi:hypothetical protein